MFEIGGPPGDGPAGDGRGRRDDEEARVAAEEEGEVLHQAVAQLLGEQEIRGGRLFADGDEDLVGGVEAREVVDASAELGEDSDGVGQLALGEEGDGDVDDFVAGGFVGGESCAAYL